MANTLKPISEGMRKFLLQIGETPEQHQREKLGQKARLPKKDRYTPPSVQPASAVVAKWKTPEPTWLADARVLFTRTRSCKHCGSVILREMHYTETFIRMRSKVDPRTIKYIPARSALFANLELPRLFVNETLYSFYCPLCWSGDERPLENPVCLADLVNLPPEGTESSGESSAQPNGSHGPSDSTTNPPSPSFSQPQLEETFAPLLTSTSGTEATYSASDDQPGSDYASSSPNGLATAQPTHTLTA